MSKFYESKKFKELNKQWQSKLAETGFEDLEQLADKDMPIRPSRNVFGILTPDQFDAQFEYFSRCRSFLLSYSFKTATDKKIWSLHTEGMPYKKVAKSIGWKDDKTFRRIALLKGLMNGIHYRTAQHSDFNFIRSTMLNGVYFGSNWMRKIDKEAYYANYKNVVEKLLNETTVLIACLNSDRDVILGYAILSPDTLHYVYVKSAWRRNGIAKNLLKGFELKYYTHLTESIKHLNKNKKLVFNPFKI